MSLIQAALDKAGRTQIQAKSTTEAPAKAAEPAAAVPKPAQPGRVGQRSILDEGLERKLREVQRRGSTRRLFEWKVGAGIILLGVAVGVLPFLKENTKNATAPFPIKGHHLSDITNPNGNYRLSGITDFGDGPRAIINDEILAVGDRFSRGAFVKQIRGNEVLLEARGKEISLKLE